ncbi:hypothetical protein ACS5PJ_07165 [Pseudarthrobacter sp. YS3]|uniref:hypothetical protein n=1 Tax=Pseudarthrobacter sp. YS3 TaxID=3453718 RepID=UPI003EEC22C5
MEEATRNPGPGLTLGGAAVPAVAESILSGALQLLICGAVLVCAVAATVFAVRRHSTPDPAAHATGHTTDTVFWDVFMGSAVAIPALLIPTLASPWSGAVLTALAAGAGVAAHRGSPRILAWQSARRQRRLDLPVYTAAEAEHDTLLTRWRRYELDPASCIDYPAMTDVRRPETSALIRAMREADQLRAARHQGYVPAVARLGLALSAAEQAAGIRSAGIS